MAIPYSLLKVFAGEGSGMIGEIKDMPAEESIKYLMRPGVMGGKFLGACLDSCRIGSMTTCYWPTDVRGFMGLIKRWRNENGDNESLYHEKSIEEYWKRFELPWINHKHCPRDEKHTGTLVDSGGKVRCANKDTIKLKPSFVSACGPIWDHHSQMKQVNYFDDKPYDHSYYDDEDNLVQGEDYEDYLREKAKYDAEEAEEVGDVCYAIIREPRNVPLPFETVLRRLNIHPETKIVYCNGQWEEGPCKRLDELGEYESDLDSCRGHQEKTNALEFCFDGWTMAHHVLKWKLQGDAPWFADKVEHWPSKEHLRVCSSD